jgi:S1-C subfamily serine protease
MASINGDSGSIGIGFAIPIDTARSVAETRLANASTTG